MYPEEIVSLQRLAEGYRLMFRMPSESVAYLTGDDFVVSVSVDLDGAAIWYYDVVNGSEVKSYALGFLLFQKRIPERFPDVPFADNRDQVRFQLQWVITGVANYGSDVLSGRREWFSEYIWTVSDVVGDLRTRILTAISLRKSQIEHFNAASSPTAT
jgi:hypothetical protein